MKIIVGEGNTTYENWIPFQESELDLLNRKDFERQLNSNKVDAILAEHVWEHMSEQEGIVPDKNCYDFLKYG